MRIKTHFILFISWLVLALLIFFSSMAFAQVHTRVRVVHASNLGGIIDPRLGDLYYQLGSVFGFTSYRLLGDVSIILNENQPVEVFSQKGGSIELTLLGKYPEIADFRIVMRLKGVPVLNTQVRLSPEKTVFIGGPLLPHGAVIIALIAKF